MIGNGNLVVQHVIQIKKWNNDKCHCKRKNSCNLSTCICENIRHLKSIVGDSVIVCDEVVSITNSVSTNVTNTIPTNVTNSISIKSVIKN